VVAIAENSFTEADLLAAAGQRSFDRGAEYLDAVGDLTVFGNQITASVRGTDDYIVVLTLGARAGITGICDCPHSKGGFFCKHCVAVGLAFLRNARASRRRRKRTTTGDRAAAGDRAEAGESSGATLHSWLSSLDRDRLLLLVFDQLVEDEDWRRRLELRAATAVADIDAIGARLYALLDPAEFGDYGYIEEGESGRYAKRVEAAAAIVDELTGSGHAAEAIAVAEYAIDLVAASYRYATDPADAIWAACVDLIASHRAAYVACLAHARLAEADDVEAADADADDLGLVGFLAGRLLSEDEFPSIDIASYRDLLGPAGLQRLREQLTAAWQQAPANWKAQRAIEDFLRATGDIDALVQVREANLPRSGLACLEIAKDLQAAGRSEQALAWAERGLHMEASPPQAIESVADFVVDRYLAEGRTADAVAVRRRVFEAVREQTPYERLREAAQRAGTWPADREWALDLLRADAQAARSGRPGIRLWAGPVLIDVLTSEGEIDAAWEAALGVASEAQWLKLADLAAPTRPADALAVYLRQIKPLKQETGDQTYERMARLLEGARACHVRLGTEQTFEMYLRALRADQKRKPKLMSILDARGLDPARPPGTASEVPLSFGESAGQRAAAEP
jgi:hypothetical protein